MKGLKQRLKQWIARVLVVGVAASGFLLPAAAEDRPPVNWLVSDCESATGWATEASRGTIKRASEAAVGSGSMEIQCDGEMNFFYIIQSTQGNGGSMDFTHVTHMDFWLYTDDVNLFQYGDCAFNLSFNESWFSGGVRVSSATLKAQTLTKGWNHLHVPLDFSGKTETCDLSKIRRMRFYACDLPGQYSLRLDEVRAVNDEGLEQADQVAAQVVMDLINAIGRVNTYSELKITEARRAYEALTPEQQALVTNLATLTAAEEAFAILQGGGPRREVLISNCDEWSNWNRTGNAAVDTETFTEGTGSIRQTTSGSMMFYHIGDPIDCTGMTDIAFDFYTSDPKVFASGDSGMNFSSVSSGNWWGENGIRVERAVLYGLTLQTGWNKLKLPLHIVESPPASFSMQSVTALRFYATGAAAGTVIRLDNVRLTGPAEEIGVTLPEDMEQKPPLTTEPLSWMLSDCDTEASLQISSRAQLRNVVQVGDDTFTAFVAPQATNSMEIMIPKLTSSPLSITGYQTSDLALRLQLYVSDASAIATNGQLELTSSGRADLEEIHWATMPVNMPLQNGWNDLYLPFNEAVDTHGTLNLENINYFRFYLFLTKDIVMAIDDIKIVPQAVPELVEYFTEPDSVNKWQSAAALSWQNEALVAEGSGTVDFTTTAYAMPMPLPRRTPITIALQAEDPTAVTALAVTITDAAGKKAEASLNPAELATGSAAPYFIVVPAEMTAEEGFNFNTVQGFALTATLAAATTLRLDSVTCIVRQDEYWRDWVYDYQPEPGDYSMVVIPDIQELTAVHPAKLTALMEWIAANKQKENIQFAMSMGDVTWNGVRGDATNEAATEFGRAEEAFGLLEEAGIPYSICYGNHDYVPGATRNTDYFNRYFPYSRFSSWDSFGGGMVENKSDNLYFTLQVGDIPYLIMALEFDPSPATIQWADEVVTAHPDYNVIVTTHNYLSAVGERSTPEGDITGDVGHGEEMWQQFLKKHANVFMVLCGHVINYADPGSMAWRVDEGDNGNTVWQVMANAQDIDADRNGVGLLLMLRFSNDGRTVDFNYFSPISGYAYKTVNQFSLTLPEGQVLHTKETYTLHFETDGGDPAPADQELAEGASPLAVTPPAKEGFTFAGWYKGDEKVDLDSFTMPAEDVTLTAHWEESSAAADEAAAKAVEEAIEKLPAADKVTAADKEAIEAAKAAYDKLTEAQQALVTNKAKLDEALAALAAAEQKQADEAAAQAVEEAIEKLPAADKVTAADKEAIEAAKAAFDKLTEAQKALVGNKAKLDEAEKALAALPPALTPGDVTGDGKINAADALEILRYAVHKTDLTAEQKAAADLNGDNAINAADALAVLKKAVGK